MIRAFSFWLQRIGYKAVASVGECRHASAGAGMGSAHLTICALINDHISLIIKWVAPIMLKLSNARPAKRSVVIAGHRTSISLEAAFWVGLKAVAVKRGLSIDALVAQIDQLRSVEIAAGERAANLSSCIRVFLLHELSNSDQTKGNE